MTDIRRLETDQIAGHLPALIALLQDAVDSGASVGFLRPLSAEDARAYWLHVRAAVESSGRVLLVAFEGPELLGSVQMEPAGLPNASHRAEVMKLFVHRRAQRRGIGRALMRAIEQEARARGRRLLVLNTRVGDFTQELYEKIGYTPAGNIPGYARSSGGSLDPTVIMYRWLEEPD